MQPSIMDMQPIACEEWMAREDWFNTLRARYHPLLVSLLDTILRQEVFYVFHRGRLLLHATSSIGGSMGVLSDSFGPPSSPIRSSIIVDVRVGSSIRVLVTHHRMEDDQHVDTLVYNEERVDPHLHQLLLDSIERSQIEETELAAARAAAHRLPPPPRVETVSTETQVDDVVLPPPPPPRVETVATETQTDDVPPPPPPVILMSVETQTESVVGVDIGVTTPPLPSLSSNHSQTVVEIGELATQTVFEYADKSIQKDVEDEDGEQVEIGREADPEEIDYSFLNDDDDLEVDIAIPRVEEEEEELENGENGEEEEELENGENGEREEEMMGGDAHLNESFHRGFGGDDDENGAEGEDSDDDIPRSRLSRKRRQSSDSPPPIAHKQARIRQDFILPSVPHPTRRHSAIMMICIQSLLAVISFPKHLHNKVTGSQVDTHLQSKWKTLSITCGHRRRLVENVCHIAVARLTKSAIDNPAHKQAHKAFAKVTKKVLRGYNRLFEKADAFATSIATEYTGLPPRAPHLRPHRVTMDRHHKRTIKGFKKMASTHLERVHDWTMMAKELPF